MFSYFRNQVIIWYLNCDSLKSFVSCIGHLIIYDCDKIFHILNVWDIQIILTVLIIQLYIQI